MDSGAPWEAHKSSIKTVVFTGGVTVVGAETFKDCGSLTSVDFGGSMREIDSRAFQNCKGLTSISLPSTFRRFGASSFEGCSNLTEVYCAGNMPSFNANCLWNGNYITVYHPVNNPWPQEYVEELETNFGGRLQVMASDGSDPYESTQPEETVKPTETATEPTTVPTTEPEETEPATEATTEPTTEATTVPTETAETTEETTVPAEEEADEGSSGWLWLFIVPLVLTVLLVSLLIIRGMLRRGGKYAED